MYITKLRLRFAHAQRPDTVSWGHVLRVDSPPVTQGVRNHDSPGYDIKFKYFPAMEATMEAEGESPPRQHTRKRSMNEPREPRAKRRAVNAATVAAENAAVAVSMHPGILSAWRRAGRGTGQGWPKLDENCTSSCSDTSSAPVSAAAPSAILARRAPRTPSANRLDNRLKSRLFERTVVVGPQSPLRRIAACHCGTHTICSHAIYKTGLNPVV